MLGYELAGNTGLTGDPVVIYVPDGDYQAIDDRPDNQIANPDAQQAKYPSCAL